jgi:hypothetical protein
MLAVALVMMFGGDEEDAGGLYDGLQPLITQVSLDVPESQTCRHNEADAEYRKYFAEGPALPAMMDGKRLKVSGFDCSEIGGRRVMRAVYDAPDGERFGLVVFSCDCLNSKLAANMQAVEMEIDGKHVVLWREGEFFRALVGRDAVKLRRHMNELRGAV